LFRNRNQYIACTADVKIAFTTEQFALDHDIGNHTPQHGSLPTPDFENKVTELSAVSNLVFSFGGELHSFYWDIWNKCHHDNVYWVVPGTVTDDLSLRNNIIIWNDWFKIIADLYKTHLSHKLLEVSYVLPKIKYFDALLGRTRKNRDAVYTGVHDHHLRDKFIMTYTGDTPITAQSDFIWEKDCCPAETVMHGTHSHCNYNGVEIGVSRIIPVDIFNQTAYSIVAETNIDNTLSFYTEKTAKPIIARRLFVAFTGYKFLENLQGMGFKTFDSVIDESYDQILDDNVRYKEAFDQVRFLCNADQVEIYSQVKDTLDHNYNLLVSTDWNRAMLDQVQQKINSI
jgi:hypothetical protein